MTYDGCGTAGTGRPAIVSVGCFLYIFMSSNYQSLERQQCRFILFYYVRRVLSAGEETALADSNRLGVEGMGLG